MERIDDPKPCDEHIRKALVAEANAGKNDRDTPIALGNVTGLTARRWPRCPQDRPACAT
jgi:hypothetical protein